MEKIDTQKLIDIAIYAGDIILEIYNHKDFGIESKADESPVTKADLAANSYICEQLHKLYPEIPILSEESEQTPYLERKDWQNCFIVDPLDGTKEFIKKNGEFTVNIAYVENGAPVEGVIFAPVLKTVYFTKGGKSFKRIDGVDHVLPIKHERSSYIVVASRSHLSVPTQKFIDDLEKTHNSVEIMSVGSSLKLCMVAEGSADCYPRLGPTMEWDIAAAQAIVEGAGGRVLNFETKKALEYNKENLLNPFFVTKI